MPQRQAVLADLKNITRWFESIETTAFFKKGEMNRQKKRKKSEGKRY